MGMPHSITAEEMYALTRLRASAAEAQAEGNRRIAAVNTVLELLRVKYGGAVNWQTGEISIPSAEAPE